MSSPSPATAPTESASEESATPPPAEPRNPAGPAFRRGAIALPSIVAGIGLALSLPPWGFWILAFPSAGLLWWRLAGIGPRARLWAGWLAGLGLYVPGLAWARSFTIPGAMVLIAVEALFVAVACLAVPPRGVVGRALAFPAAMTLAEALRLTWPFGGLPIGGVFLGQADGPVLGVARLGGPLALTFVVYLGGVALASLVEAAFRTTGDRGLPTATRWRTGAAALLAVLVVVVVGGLAPDGGPSVGTVATAAVQGGGARGFRKSQIDPATVLDAQLAATQRMQQLDHGHAPALVLWPEDVVSLDTELNNSPEKAVLAELARRLHTTLVVGITETVSSTAFQNEAVAFGPDGSVVARYEKVHRVPFGEYVPDRSFFAHLGNLSAVPLDAIPGTGSGLMTTPVAPLGAMISFEVFYGNRGRPSVRAGAQLLIVPTNTSSYGTAQVPTQEVAASEVQAVQQGRDLLQAAPTGYSAAVTNRGVLVSRSTLGARQVLFATLSRRVGWTIYVRYGDLPVLLLGTLGLLGGWLLGRRRRPVGRHRSTPTTG